MLSINWIMKKKKTTMSNLISWSVTSIPSDQDQLTAEDHQEQFISKCISSKCRKSVRTCWPSVFSFYSESEDLDIADSPLVTAFPADSDDEECAKISECESKEAEDRNNQGPTRNGEVDTPGAYSRWSHILHCVSLNKSELSRFCNACSGLHVCCEIQH